MTITLERYEQAEPEMSMHDARIGLLVHAVVTVVVVTAVVVVNIVVASEFPWSVFVAFGMGVGLFFHWFGYRRAETDIRARQARGRGRARVATHV